MTERAWLDVPFAEKNEAKAQGARWDPNAKRWYSPRAGIAGLERWAALPDVPDLLPGEDRSCGSGLFVDLVPSSCWFTNVRSCVSPRDWERLRRMITRRAGNRCEACGAGEDRTARRWLEAHERWTFEERNRTQTLRRLICLCTSCHTVTHFGLATIKGTAAEAFSHLRNVTGMSEQDAHTHVRSAFALWERRSAVTWTLNLDILTKAGVTISSPPQAAARVSVAERTLRADGYH
ncbi:DUF5710 domain-containing protein [Allokutzneria sp. A3M-2-11 16]|uniref:DUF5710 domain-containing protein n=1 Tax=Allokutzneria sp. A3M-2-11 16 TaxID=2962043 RepID=UPI0020B88814|nr:DUF5710 domain-containing protein [Allokutzneria sp. A3M-2-11 16]MCP3804266.1 DUF5710 domain-containing protein [Allokutzneria sp. A3M-2-11 16]